MSMRVAQAIVAKDLRTEVRSRSAVSTVLPFAATMLLAFGFALGPDRLLLAQTAPALLWLAALFASVELCHRSYQHEAANDALEAYCSRRPTRARCTWARRPRRSCN